MIITTFQFLIGILFDSYKPSRADGRQERRRFQFLIGILFDSYYALIKPHAWWLVSIPYRYSIRLLQIVEIDYLLSEGMVSIPYRYSIRLLLGAVGKLHFQGAFQFLIGILFDSYPIGCRRMVIGGMYRFNSL